MNRSTILLIGASIFFLLQHSSPAQNTAKGTLSGFVYNATPSESVPEGNGLAEQDVVLYQYVDGKTAEGVRPHTTTDDRGHFEFTGLKVSPRFTYYPASVINGIEYLGDVISLTSDNPEGHSDVAAFALTQSDSAVTVAMQHVILTPMAGKLHVKEVSVFSNRSRYTYVGHLSAGQPGKNIVLQFEVPENATEVQFGGDLMGCCAVVNGNRIFDTMAFKPGTRREVVSYVVPYDGRETDFIKRLGYDIATVDIFLPEDAGTLSAPGFTSQGSFQIRGQHYQRFTASNLAKGGFMKLTLAQLPPAPRDWRRLPPVVLGVLALTGVIIYFRNRKVAPRESGQNAGGAGITDPNGERRRLLEEILQLDDAFAADRLDEETYVSAREKLQELIFALDQGQVSETVLPKRREDMSHEDK